MIPKFKCLNPIPMKVDFKYDINIPNPHSKENINKEWTRADYLADDYNRKQGAILAPCGKCFLCKKKRVSEWFIRYICEKDMNYKDSHTLFITLTYKDLNNNPSLDYRDVQLFLKRLRKHFSDYKLKFLCVGEYGMKTNRKHWHLMVLGFKELPDHYKQLIQHIWNLGYTDTKICDENTVYYLLKYSFKSYHKDNKYYEELGLKPPMFRCSQGFGKDFVLYYKDRLLADRYISYNGIKYSLPRYYIMLFRKMRLLDGWTLLEQSNTALQEYCVTVLEYFNNPLGLSPDETFHDFSDLCLFRRKVKNKLSELNSQKYYDFFKDFEELL